MLIKFLNSIEGYELIFRNYWVVKGLFILLQEKKDSKQKTLTSF
jgi:hypothetical protein